MHLLIVPKQVYKTGKNKSNKAYAYSPETGQTKKQDRQKKLLNYLLIFPKQVYQTDKNK